MTSPLWAHKAGSRWTRKMGSLKVEGSVIGTYLHRLGIVIISGKVRWSSLVGTEPEQKNLVPAFLS